MVFGSSFDWRYNGMMVMTMVFSRTRRRVAHHYIKIEKRYKMDQKYKTHRVENNWTKAIKTSTPASSTTTQEKKRKQGYRHAQID
jgi:hypothetical protein